MANAIGSAIIIALYSTPRDPADSTFGLDSINGYSERSHPSIPPEEGLYLIILIILAQKNQNISDIVNFYKERFLNFNQRSACSPVTIIHFGIYARGLFVNRNPVFLAAISGGHPRAIAHSGHWSRAINRWYNILLWPTVSVRSRWLSSAEQNVSIE